jgi:hypothetical protein
LCIQNRRRVFIREIVKVASPLDRDWKLGLQCTNYGEMRTTGLLKRIPATAIGVGACVFIQFGVVESIKRVITAWNKGEELSLVQQILAGSIKCRRPGNPPANTRENRALV